MNGGRWLRRCAGAGVSPLSFRPYRKASLDADRHYGSVFPRSSRKVRIGNQVKFVEPIRVQGGSGGDGEEIGVGLRGRTR